MPTMIYPMRLKRDESALFKSAARRKGVSVAEFLRQAGRHAARQMEDVPASLLLRERLTVIADDPASPAPVKG